MSDCTASLAAYYGAATDPTDPDMACRHSSGDETKSMAKQSPAVRIKSRWSFPSQHPLVSRSVYNFLIG